MSEGKINSAVTVMVQNGKRPQRERRERKKEREISPSSVEVWSPVGSYVFKDISPLPTTHPPVYGDVV